MNRSIAGLAALGALLVASVAANAAGPPPLGLQHLYVSDIVANRVNTYALQPDGFPSPSVDRTIYTPTPWSIAIDGSGDLHVGSYNGNAGTVDVYAPDGTRLRELDLNFPVVAMTVNPRGDTFVVAGLQGNVILVYPPGARGSANPTATLVGGTGTYLTFGPDGRLYELCYDGSIEVFDRPLRSASGPSFSLSAPGPNEYFSGAMTFDAAGSLFASYYPTSGGPWSDEDVDVIHGYGPRRIDHSIYARDCYRSGDLRGERYPGQTTGLATRGRYLDVACYGDYSGTVYVYYSHRYERQHPIEHLGGLSFPYDLKIGP